MYKEYGTDMFRHAGRGVCPASSTMETPQNYIAARDPIGIRPLYYGYDTHGVIVFASEPKNLVGLVDEIMPFPPGHYYKDGEFVCYNDIAAGRCRYVMDDLETVCSQNP